MAETSTDPTVLSPAAQRAVETKKLSGRRKFARLRKLLAELAHFDKVTDKAQKRAKLFTCLSLVGLLLLSVGTVFLQVRASNGLGSAWMPLLPGVPALALLVLAILQGVRWRKLARADLANEFHRLLLPFLDAVSADVDPKGKIGVRLDLSGLTKDKILSKKKVPPGRYRKIVETVYKDPWCDLQISAADGSTLMVRIEDTATSFDLHWTKRSRSGKIKFKHKRKWKRVVAVDTAVVPDGEKLAWDQAQVEGLSGQEKVKLREKPKGNICRLVRKFKSGSTGEPPEPGVNSEDLVGMFIQLYSMLKPAEIRS
jgi:hypothetical protein